MTFKHTSRALVAAVSLFLPNCVFANSASPISGFQSSYHSPSSQPRFYASPLCDICDHTIEDAIRTETVLPHMQDSLKFTYGSSILKAVNSQSASADLQIYSSFDREENNRADPAVHYPVVEPGTLTLFGTGLVLLAGVIRRKTAKS